MGAAIQRAGGGGWGSLARLDRRYTHLITPSTRSNPELDLSRYDEEIAEELRRYPPPPPGIADLKELRSACDAYFEGVRSRSSASTEGMLLRDDFVPSLVDDHEIPIRIYTPTASGSAGILAYFHGGAFCLGGLELEEERCISLARETPCIIVSVEYRLAPENPFPLPLEDCYSTLTWIAEHRDALNAAGSNLAVGGCSSGAALAASVAQLCRARNGPALALQALLYPVLDSSLTEQSILELTNDEIMDKRRMWSYYLDKGTSSSLFPGSPAAIDSLDLLAPALLVVAELDGLRDEAISYARRLLAARVSVELQLWPKAPHAFELFAPRSSLAQEAMRQQAAAIARGLEAIQA